MPSRVVVTGMVLLIIVSFVTVCVNLLVPVSAKFEMNTYCRSTLLKMEIAGGLTDKDRDNLYEGLASRGFRNIEINGTVSARLGDYIELTVEADYPVTKLTDVFGRKEGAEHMVYRKRSVCRKVINQ